MKPSFLDLIPLLSRDCTKLSIWFRVTKGDFSSWRQQGRPLRSLPWTIRPTPSSLGKPHAKHFFIAGLSVINIPDLVYCTAFNKYNIWRQKGNTQSKRCNQCSGSVTFWYGSGSLDLYFGLRIQDRALLTVAFNITTKWGCFFQFFLFLTVGRYINVKHTDPEHCLKGIFQPFELGGVTRLIRSAVKFWKAGNLKFFF